MTVNGVRYNPSYVYYVEGQGSSAKATAGTTSIDFTSNSSRMNASNNLALELREELEKQKEDQGIVSKAWDGIKGFFGAKTSSSNVEKTIEQFENGEISQDEARKVLDEYKNAQNTFTDKLSGVVSIVGLVGTVAGAIMCATGIGAAIGAPLLAISGKVALGGMFIDNALDLVDNSTDADGLTGDELKDLAIETGIEAASYMVGRGIGKMTGNINTNVADKLVKKGTGEITSKVLGYATEVAVDGSASLIADYGIAQADSLMRTGETIAFNDYWSIDRFKSEGRSQLIGVLTGIATSKYSPSASVAAGAGVGVASVKNTNVDAPEGRTLNPFASRIDTDAENVTKITADYSSRRTESSLLTDAEIQARYMELKKAGITDPDILAIGSTRDNVGVEKIIELYRNAQELGTEYGTHQSEATIQMKEIFGEDVTGRPKGVGSVGKKLINKQNNGKELTDISASRDAIGDAYGTRLQIGKIDPAEAEQIVIQYMKANNIDISYDDFIKKYIMQSTGKLTQDDNVTRVEVLNLLKTVQTRQVADDLVNAIRAKKLHLTEINNYGDDLTAYFTDEQLARIVKACYETYGEHLVVVTKNVDSLKGAEVAVQGKDGKMTKMPVEQVEDIEVKAKGAVKNSGYATSQMNVTHEFGGLGEFQIRGGLLNAFADVEHIPYDIRQGKITVLNGKYASVYSLIKNMDEVTYREYNEYITKCYEQLRLQELGIPCNDEIKLTFSQATYTVDELRLLSKDGLIEIASGH